MSAEHGEISDISGGEEINAAPGIEPLMEPLQPRRTAVPHREKQARPQEPFPVLLPIPDPQTPAPMPALSVPDPQTPAPFPEFVFTPAVPNPETPPTGIFLNAPVINPITPPVPVLPPLTPARPGVVRRLPATVTPHFHTLSPADLQRRKRLRKVFLRHHSRKQLRAARAKDRQTRRRFWTTLASTTLSLLLIFLSV